MFIVIILNVSTNKKGLILLENKFFNFLGKISYGLYMYHMMIVVFVIQMVAKIHIEIGVRENILIYFCSVGLSILVAWLSYEYFEKLFLKLKPKFTIVKSGKI
jgi:peptidoglycan/LPS O-acetylase OafA/YrhL